MTDDDFDAVINVHLRGTFTCVREAFGYFKDKGVAGRIITIGSPTGQRGTEALPCRPRRLCRNPPLP